MSSNILGGRYQIIRQLGSGGFGHTFLAIDQHLPGHPYCVVKQLKPKIQRSDTLRAAKQLFEAEARVLHQLGHHDQIPRLTAHFQEDQETYLVQEYIEGIALNQAWKGCLPLPEAEVRSFLQELLDILVFIHHHRVVHRDLKPSNLIRRTIDRKLVLIDFGAVWQLDQESTADPLMIVGSSGYAPPEQLLGVSSFSSDLYAVGMMGIQAITGSSPKHLQRDPQTHELYWRDQAEISPEFAEVLDRLVRYDHQQRYQSAVEALEALQSLQVNCPSESNATAWRERGDYLFQRHHYREAIAAYEKALEIQPTDTQLWYKQGLAFDESQCFEEALDCYDRVIRQQPNHAQAWLKRGVVLENLGRLEAALDCYASVVDLQPDSYWAWYDRGKLLESLERWEEAITSYSRAIEIKPNFQLAVESRKRLLIDQGDAERLIQWGHYPEALKVIETVQRQSPTQLRPLLTYGIALSRLKRYDEARAVFEDILAAHPDCAEAWLEKGLTFHHQNQPDAALACLERVIQLENTIATAWYHRGRVLETMQSYETAMLSYNRALELQPDLASALTGRTRALSQLQSTPPIVEEDLDDSTIFTGILQRPSPQEASSLLSALALAQTAPKLGPTTIPVTSHDATGSWLLRGRLLEKVRNHRAAIVAYNRAMRLNPDDPEVLKSRGNVLFALGRYDEAIASYDRAIHNQPENPVLWCCLASCLMKLKRFRESIACFDRAIHLKPESPLPWYWRGRALIELKQYEEALRSFKQAIAHKPDFQPAVHGVIQIQKLLGKSHSSASR